MTKGNETMYGIAYAKALEIGPRVVTLRDGRKVSVYCLNRDELKDIFDINQFNIDGVVWLKWIYRWSVQKGDRAPSKAVILSPGSEWVYIFMNIDKDDLIDLKIFAENNNAPSLTNETKQTVLQGFLS